MSLRKHPHTPAGPTFRLRPIPAALVAGLSLFGPGLAQGADDKSGADVAALQAQVAQLKAALEKSEKELAGYKGAPATGSAAGQTTAPSTAPKASSGSSTLLDAVVIKSQAIRNPLEEYKEVPRSVSAVSGEELDRFGATNITEVLRKVNNVNFNWGNPRTGSLTLRGVTTGSSDQIDPSTGLVIDGVPLAYSPIANGYTYTDIDTVEVTHGPQGTLGYKNASTGQIEINNRRPSFTSEASASLTYGDWHTLKSYATIGGAVQDDVLAWRGTILREQAEGPWKNGYAPIAGRSAYNSTDRTFGRTQFLLTPSANFNALLSLEYQPKGGEYINGLTWQKAQPTRYSDGVAVPNSTLIGAAEYKIANRGWFNRYSGYSAATYLDPNNPIYSDVNGSIMTESKGATLQAEWKLPGHTLKSISGYRYQWFSAANGDATPFDVTTNGGYIQHYSQKTQELRLTSDKGRLVDYTAGLFYLTSHNDSLTRTQYGSDAGAWYAVGDGTAGNGTYGLLANPTTAKLTTTPGLAGSGKALLTDVLKGAYQGTDTVVDNQSTAAYGSADWHLSEPLTLTTGLRVSQEDRNTSQYKRLLDNGISGTLFNPVSSGAVQLGGFASDTSGNLLSSNSAAQLALADQLAKTYFGVTGYSALNADQKAQVAAAKTIRTTVTSGLYDTYQADPWNGRIKTGNLSLRNKFAENLTVYGTVQYGEKAGISQSASVNATSGLPLSNTVKPEKYTSYELGLRTSQLDRTLVLNADVFWNDIKDFQQTVNFIDPVESARQTSLTGTPTTVYVSGVGNVNAVRVKGLELDATYSGIKNTNLRFSGTYNDARYVDYKNAGLAAEQDPAAYPSKLQDLSGRTLPNAPKVSFNLSAEYRQPVWGDKVFHTAGNYKWTSRYNIDSALSQFSWVDSYGLLDLGIGVGRQDGKFDVNFVAKNVLDKQPHIEGWTSYGNLVQPRWLGVVFTGKLY